MSDIETPQLPETRPETRIEHVAEYTKKNGKVVPAHDRIVPAKRKQKPRKAKLQPGEYDPVSHRRVPKSHAKRGPIPGQPRMTSPAHARYLRDRLDLPITYFTTLRHAMPHDSEIDQLLYECHAILKTVQIFVGRFTTEKDMSDDQ